MGNSHGNGTLGADYYRPHMNCRFEELEEPTAEKFGYGTEFRMPAAAELRRGLETATSSILGRKTPNIRELFIIGRYLGHGESGTTYLCTEIATGIEYACKSVPKRKLLFKTEAEDLHREIEILQHLAGHPNVVTIKGVYEDDSAVHIVMELCTGGDLFNHIKKRGPCNEQRAAGIMKVVVQLVAACHSRGVMHRDLKLENFLLINEDDNSPVKAVDFGLSVFFKPGQKFSDLVGSPYYIAPEVLHKHYGPEADIWSLGVMLYILLSGVPPFWAETQQGIFNEVLKGEIDFKSDPWPQISDSAKDLIKQILHPRPSDRLKAHEILCHPWMCGSENQDIDPTILFRLKQFPAINDLKRLALLVIAETLSEDADGLRKIFNIMDVDNNGVITFDELKEGLRKCGPIPTDAELHDLMKAIDNSGNGSIKYRELVAATCHPNKLDCEEYLMTAFSLLDKDGSGGITIDELQVACQEYNMHNVHVQKIFEHTDQNNDGHIDYAEFVAVIHQEAGR